MAVSKQTAIPAGALIRPVKIYASIAFFRLMILTFSFDLFLKQTLISCASLYAINSVYLVLDSGGRIAWSEILLAQNGNPRLRGDWNKNLAQKTVRYEANTQREAGLIFHQVQYSDNGGRNKLVFGSFKSLTLPQKLSLPNLSNRLPGSGARDGNVKAPNISLSRRARFILRDESLSINCSKLVG